MKRAASFVVAAVLLASCAHASIPADVQSAEELLASLPAKASSLQAAATATTTPGARVASAAKNKNEFSSPDNNVVTNLNKNFYAFGTIATIKASAITTGKASRSHGGNKRALLIKASKAAGFLANVQFSLNANGTGTNKAAGVTATQAWSAVGFNQYIGLTGGDAVLAVSGPLTAPTSLAQFGTLGGFPGFSNAFALNNVGSTADRFRLTYIGDPTSSFTCGALLTVTDDIGTTLCEVSISGSVQPLSFGTFADTFSTLLARNFVRTLTCNNLVTQVTGSCP